MLSLSLSLSRFNYFKFQNCPFKNYIHLIIFGSAYQIEASSRSLEGNKLQSHRFDKMVVKFSHVFLVSCPFLVNGLRLTEHSENTANNKCYNGMRGSAVEQHVTLPEADRSIIAQPVESSFAELRHRGTTENRPNWTNLPGHEVPRIDEQEFSLEEQRKYTIVLFFSILIVVSLPYILRTAEAYRKDLPVTPEGVFAMLSLANFLLFPWSSVRAS